MISVADRLRLHARRCRNEQGYRTPGGMPRLAFAALLRKWSRQCLKSDGGWHKHAASMFVELDKVNTGERHDRVQS